LPPARIRDRAAAGDLDPFVLSCVARVVMSRTSFSALSGGGSIEARMPRFANRWLQDRKHRCNPNLLDPAAVWWSSSSAFMSDQDDRTDPRRARGARSAAGGHSRGYFRDKKPVVPSH
jgi:hypothetical protein